MKTIFSAILMVVFAVGIHAQSRLEMPKNKSQNKELILLNFQVQTGVFHASSFIKISSKPMNLKSWKQKMSSFTSMQIFREIKKSAFPELKKENASLADQYKKKDYFLTHCC
jgi:hypothetical protein